MRGHQRKILALVGAGLVVLCGANRLLANGHETLVRLLTPAALAQQFAQMCQQVEPTFLEPNMGAYGRTSEFLEHVKSEVLDGLSDDKLTAVVEITMDVVRQARRYELSLLSSGSEKEEVIRLKAWCDTQVKPFLLHVLQSHTSRHDEFMIYLKEAKREHSR